MPGRRLFSLVRVWGGGFSSSQRDEDDDYQRDSDHENHGGVVSDRRNGDWVCYALRHQSPIADCEAFVDVRVRLVDAKDFARVGFIQRIASEVRPIPSGADNRRSRN